MINPIRHFIHQDKYSKNNKNNAKCNMCNTPIYVNSSQPKELYLCKDCLDKKYPTQYSIKVN